MYIRYIFLTFLVLVVAKKECLKPPIVPNPIDTNAFVVCRNGTWFGYGSTYLNVSRLRNDLVLDGDFLIVNAPGAYDLGDCRININGSLTLEGSLLLHEGLRNFNISKNLVLGRYVTIKLDYSYCLWKKTLPFANIYGVIYGYYDNLENHQARFGQKIKLSIHIKDSGRETIIDYQVDNMLLYLFIHNVPLVIVTCFSILIFPLFIYFIYKSIIKACVYRRLRYSQLYNDDTPAINFIDSPYYS